MEQEFLNLYIEKMNKKIEDLIKSEIMRETQLEMATRQIAILQQEIEVLSKKNKKVSTKDSDTF